MAGPVRASWKVPALASIIPPSRAPGDRGQAVVDVFRVRNGKLVEHWDAIQDVPEAAANDNTMF
jgi:predicted SnoaL-like aldol condensation-catalyzing enzyme